MKFRLVSATLFLAAISLTACAEDVQRVGVPAANDPNAYQPQVQQKPMPPDAGGPQPQGQQLPPGAQPGQPLPPPPAPGQSGTFAPQPNAAQMASAGNGLPEEEAFVAAYENRRRPRIMVFVNRTIHGDVLPSEDLQELIRTEETQSATGGVKVNNQNTTNGQSTSTGSTVGYAGSTANASTDNTNTAKTNSFETNGPATYTKTTSVKVAPDKPATYDEIGATREDYEMIELSLIDYLDSGGRVTIEDSDMARGKLDREKILRIENSDPAAIRLLNTELQTDVLIQVRATPTHQSQWPNGAVRLLAKAVSTTDGRILSTTFVDMPLPMSKTNVNVFTRYLAEKMMQKMIAVWSGNPNWDPLEVRIYKAAGVDDTLAIRKMIQKLAGVQRVTTQGATGGSTTAYAVLSVAYSGAPEDLYGDLKDSIKSSTGLKAVDLQGNTIDLEVTGPMNLVTTTKNVETKITTETTTTENKTVEPIRPAPDLTSPPVVIPPPATAPAPQ